jgi:formyl-CoA transferase
MSNVALKPQALSDIRVLDLSRVLAGPYATMMLADYGAEVIKIEQPGQGDGTRQWGPPWVGPFSAYFLSVNRNKRSVTVNLKSEAGQTIIRKLAARADIVVENFKVGTMQRLGLDYETLSASNPGLIYCSISGYGQDGPYKERPGYDFMIQAHGGIMSITGPAAGPPHKVGVAIVDITAGLYAVNAILAALHHRERTGQGQYIDVALLDAQIGWLANVAQNYFATGESPQRYGNAHPNIVPYETFETADSFIALAVGSDAQYQRLCQVIQRPDLWQDERFRRNAGRVHWRETLIPELQAVFRERNTEDWMQALLAAKIPASPINDVPAVFDDPQVKHRQMAQSIQHHRAGEMTLLGPVAKLSATPATIHTPPPELGQDTVAVLQEHLGLTSDDIAQLQESGVL